MSYLANQDRQWQKKPLRGVFLMLLGLALYPLSDSLIKHLIGTYPIEQVFFLRAVSRIIPLSIALFFVGGPRHVFSTTKIKEHLVRLGVNLVQTSAFIFAFSLGSLTSVYTFSYSSSFFMILLSSLFLKEIISKEKWIAVGLGFVGILIALRPNSSLLGPLALVVLLGSFAGALNKVLMRRLAKTEHSLAIAIYPNIVMILLTLPFVYFSWQAMPLVHWGLFGLVGLCTAGAQYSVAQALRFAQGSTLAPIDYSGFFWVLLLDFLWCGLIPDVLTMTGALIIICSNLYILYCTQKEEKKKIGGA